MINGMQKNWLILSGVLIVIVAACMRLYQLGEVPHGMTWDEAAIGYNGYSIITARRDEWLVKLPLSFRSFGDFKAPLAIYLNGFFTYFLGMKLWVFRLPFVVASIVAIGAIILLAYELFTKAINRTFAHLPFSAGGWLGVASGFILSITPWHFHFSRVGFESGISLTFLVVGTFLVVAWLNTLEAKSKSPLKVSPPLLLILGAVSLAAAMYSYHSAKVVVPGIVFLLVCLWWQPIRKAWTSGLVFLSLWLAALVPMIQDTVSGPGGERFQQASLFSKGISPPELIATIFQQFVLHLSPAFLFQGATPTLRHGDGYWGVLLWPTALLALVGVAATLSHLSQILQRRASWIDLRIPLLAGGWILIGLLPAAVGVDVPHSNRAILALPGFILLAGWGTAWLINTLMAPRWANAWRGSHQEHQTLAKMVLGVIILLHSLLFVSYLRHYFTVFAAASTAEFKDGYLETFEYVIPFEKGLDGVDPVQQIVFSSRYGQPYIYALFARRTNPIEYQGGSLNTYLFVDKITESDLERPNVLIVATGEDSVPLSKAQKIIYGLDGTVRFKIYRTP